MPRYGVEKLGVTRYEAKIKCGNAASLRLFQAVLLNPNYFLRFRLRLLNSYGSGSDF
jgi:hypothetical protein